MMRAPRIASGHAEGRDCCHQPKSHDLIEATSATGETHTYCAICGANEDELLAYCPGHRLTRETAAACRENAGNVVDMTFWKQAHQRQCGYVSHTDAHTTA